MLNFFKSLLGLNPSLPFYWEITAPMHGERAKNSRRQEVVYDEAQGKWVMPQNFSDKEPVVVKKGN